MLWCYTESTSHGISSCWWHFFSVDEAETYLNKHSIHDGRMTGWITSRLDQRSFNRAYCYAELAVSSAAVNAWPRPVLTERWPDRVTGYKARRFTWTRRLFILLLNVDELVGQESRLITRSRWSQAANTVSKRTRSVYRQTRHITGDFRDEFSRQSIVLAMTAATLTKTPRNNCLTIST